jgi:uncharacterized protein
MNKTIEERLFRIAEDRQVKDDLSHDFQHIQRVFFLAKKIGEHEKADLEVLIPAALFHDIVVYEKDSPKSINETDESAVTARKILEAIQEYPKEKIALVQMCIRECSFTKGLKPSNKESSVLQDADLLESTGAISIMRTFSSGGKMCRQFYDPIDPFRKKTQPEIKNKKVLTFALDLFYVRLLKVQNRVHTTYAKKIAKRRTEFLKNFLKELEVELKETGITH